MQFGGIGISNLPNQHCSNSTKKEHFYNLIVCGSKGLGKTTFLNNLVKKKVFTDSLYTYKQESGKKELQFFKNGLESPGKAYEVLDEFVRYDGREEWDIGWFEEYKMTFELTETEIIERGIHVNFTVLEIDNIGDCINNENTHLPIVNYISKKYKEYFEAEQKERRDKIKDTRIHACLYFFEPYGHTISQLDISNMREISKVCVLIPVVGRSDMFTVDEKEIIKSNFNQIITNEDITLFKHLNYSPFFVIGNQIDEFGVVYEREYPWGVIHSNNKYMCDTEELKNVIVRDKMLDVIEESVIFYKKFRNQLLKEEVLQYLKREDKIKSFELEDFDKFIDDWCNDRIEKVEQQKMELQ